MVFPRHGGKYNVFTSVFDQILALPAFHKNSTHSYPPLRGEGETTTTVPLVSLHLLRSLNRCYSNVIRLSIDSFEIQFYETI